MQEHLKEKTHCICCNAKTHRKTKRNQGKTTRDENIEERYKSSESVFIDAKVGGVECGMQGRNAKL